ncbi:MAG: aspartate dehydrogenase [Lachnospiraceae bacterium]|nr:aspartate dehydrogenase [Lachnospiraceae bacterium]
MFGKRKEVKKSELTFDEKTMRAVIRASICTGEQVAGFKDKETGHFTDVMLIRSPKDIEEFKRLYGIENITKEY